MESAGWIARRARFARYLVDRSTSSRVPPVCVHIAGIFVGLWSIPAMGQVGIRIGRPNEKSDENTTRSPDFKRLIAIWALTANGQQCALDEAGCILKAV